MSELEQTFKRGKTIGKWELDRELGRGGQGSVWQVRENVKVKNRAVLAMKLCTDCSDIAKARFENEVAILVGLGIAGCPTVLDSHLSWGDGYAYYVMDLAHPLDAGEFRQAPQRALEVLRELLATLNVLHERSILHRDLKPANLMMAAPPGRLLLTDFGIAQRGDGNGLTRTGEVVGSQFYRAPEIVYGADATAASEVYGAGRVMEWLFSGQDPTMMTPTRIGGPGISDRLAERLNEVMDKACAMDPGARYQSTQEFADALPQVWVDVAVTQASAVAPALPPARHPALAMIEAKNEVGWRDSMIRLRPQVHQRLVEWRERAEADSAFLRRPGTETLTEFVAAMGELWSWPILACVHGFPATAFRVAMNDLLEVQPWKPHGTTALIEFPRSAAWALQNLCGAAAAQSGFTEAIASHLRTPLPEERGRLVSLVDQFDLMQVPGWIGHASHAWTTLQNFAEIAWIAELFGSESQYRDALFAYLWALNVALLAMAIRTQTPGLGVGRGWLVLCTADADRNERAMRLAFGAPGALDRFAAAHDVQAQALRDLWPTWCEALRQQIPHDARSAYHHSRALPALPSQ